MQIPFHSERTTAMKIEKLDENMRYDQQADSELAWHDPARPPFRLAGFAWFSQDGVFRRLPVNADWPLREAVSQLADLTAGGQVQFQTDSTRLALRVELAAPANMCHMAPTGQCGFDCYIGPPKAQVYCATARFDPAQRDYEWTLFEHAAPGMRMITLNFPLYQGVKSVRIGLDANAAIQAPPQYDDPRPVVWYGTSITQGGCATRPGMAHTNILSRWFNRQIVNLGFSGNGRGEPEMARIIAQIPNPGCLTLDYDPNAPGDILTQTLPPFIGILRAAHPQVPILVITRTTQSLEHFDPKGREQRLARRDFQRRTVAEFRSRGDGRIFFFDGSSLLGDDADSPTVDGGHPTDLGFWRMAEALRPAFAALFGMETGEEPPSFDLSA